MTLNNPRPGPNHVAEYQISALPYVTASSVITASIARIDFPYVTSFISIKNASAAGILGVGFSHSGTMGSNKFTLAASASFGADFRVKTLFLTSVSPGTTEFEVVAGLTLVEPRFFPVLTSSAVIPNGSPSTGSFFGYSGL